MAIRDKGTEQRIMDTAKHIFFAEGKLNATTQDIADAAGVSRTLVNYYFRSVDSLIDRVYREAMADLSLRLDKVMESDVPFKEKVAIFIEVFAELAIKYPYQETFVVKDINTADNAFTDEDRQVKTEIFLKQIKAEMDAGHIEQMNPIHFMMNLFALMSYPMIMRPMFMRIFKLDNEQFKQLIEERKALIFKTIFR
jgi:AcrR family transcriptional regulator